MPNEPEQKLSRTEWKVMNICWRLGSATARQIYEESLGDQDREYRTVKTLLDRIAAKGYLETEKLGPLVVYTPAVERRSTLREAVGDFVDTVLGRSLGPLVLHLAEREDLSRDERQALEGLIEKFGDPDAEAEVDADASSVERVRSAERRRQGKNNEGGI